MSLIGFHKFLITTAIVFSFVLAARQFADFRDTGNGRMLIAALAFAGAGVALAFYLRHLRRFLKMPEPLFLPSQTDLLAEPSLSRADSSVEGEPGASGNGHRA